MEEIKDLYVEFDGLKGKFYKSYLLPDTNYDTKEEMEAALASYLDEGCDDLIGPINDGDTLEQDMQDAGLLE